MRTNLLFPLTNFVIICACTKFCTSSTGSEKLTGNKHKRQKQMRQHNLYTSMWAKNIYYMEAQVLC